MKNLFYDLHIHSCLSPCGDDDMTPNNICNMAVINGLNIIALTDHNSCKNCESTMKIGKSVGLIVIPGMELCTSEEIHVICLFDILEKAIGFDNYVSKHSVKVKNNPNIFGRQLIMDDMDNIISEQDNLLITCSNISISDVPKIVDNFGGVYFPAHIDRSSYSIISVLGTIPNEIDTNVFEVSNNNNISMLTNNYPILKNKTIISNSDAHYLEQIKYYKDCIPNIQSQISVNSLFTIFKK